MSTPESNMGGAPPPTAPMPVPTPHAPPAGNGAAAAPGATPGRSPRPMGLPPPSPAQPGSLPRGSGRRSMDGGNSRRSTDGGRRSIDGGRRGRHTVEVPEGAERHEGLVVSRQEKVRCMLSLVCCLLFGHRCKLRNASIGMRVRLRSCCEVWQLAPIWRTSLDSCRDELACSITCCCCRCCRCSTHYCCHLQLCSKFPTPLQSPSPAPQFGFIKCSTHEGRYFFHVNDTDGQAAYGSTVRRAASCWARCPC